MTQQSVAPVVPASGGSRLVDILLQFAQHRTLTAAQLTDATGIPASAVYRYLATLVMSGLVAHTSRHGEYSAGPESLRLATNFRQEALVKSRIGQHLRRLCDQTHELAAYLVVSGNRALCLEAIEGPHTLRCSYSAGLSLLLHRGASAYALLAHLPEQRRSQIVEGLELTPTAEADLRNELRLVAERGFATSDGAVDAGVWGVSFPVFDDAGKLTGAVSTMAPSARTKHRQKLLIAHTRTAAASLSPYEGGGL